MSNGSADVVFTAPMSGRSNSIDACSRIEAAERFVQEEHVVVLGEALRGQLGIGVGDTVQLDVAGLLTLEDVLEDLVEIGRQALRIEALPHLGDHVIHACF